MNLVRSVNLSLAGVVDLEVLVGVGAGVSEHAAGHIHGAASLPLAHVVDLPECCWLNASG